MKTKTKKPALSSRPLPRLMYKMRARYLLILPFLAFLGTFKYAPMYGLVLAFKDYKVRKGILGSPWAGFEHFEMLFSTFSFKEVLGNTIILSLMKVFLYFPVPIILALFINEIRNERLKKTFQTFSYLPHFISWVIAASFLTDVLALNGPINLIIEALGGEKIYFMADKAWFRWVILFSKIWKDCGWGAIVYMAAIAGIDQDMYEAAEIDGAKKLQKIWYITLPCIRTTIITLFILDLGKIMSAGFDQVYNLYSPAVYSVADILDTYTYRKGILDHDYSYATAAGLFQNLVGFILVIVSNIVVKKVSDGEEGLW